MAYIPGNYSWSVSTGQEQHGGEDSSQTLRFMVAGKFLGTPTTVEAAWGQTTEVERRIYSLTGVPQLYDTMFPNSTLLVKSRKHQRLAADPRKARFWGERHDGQNTRLYGALVLLEGWFEGWLELHRRKAVKWLETQWPGIANSRFGMATGKPLPRM